MASDAYSVAVRISLINRVSGALGLIMRDFARTEQQAGKLQRRMTALQGTMIKGGMYIAAGAAIAMAFKAPLDAANELNTRIQQVAALGFGDKLNGQALRFARSMNIFGLSLSDKVGIMRDTLALFNSLPKAEMVAPLVSKMIVGNRALYGKERGDEITKGVMPLLRVAELRGGLNDPVKMAAEMNWAQKAYIASGGNVNGTQYQNAMRAGGIPLKMMSDVALFVKSEPIIQEMGGFRFGTGLNAAFNNLVEGRLPVRAVDELMKYGLVNKNMVEWTKIGTVKRMLPGGLKGQDEFIQDPYAWMDDILLPSLKQKGMNTNDQLKVVTEIGAFLTNSRGANIFSTAYLQHPAIARAMSRIPQAMNIEQTYGLAPKTLQGAESNLDAQWNTLMADIGTQTLPSVVYWMNKLSGALTSVDSAIKAHPTITKAASYGVLGIGALAIFKGATTIVGGLLNFARIPALVRVAIGPLSRTMLTLGRVALPLLAGAFEVLFSPITLTIAAVAAVGAALYEMWAHWDSTKGFIWNIKNELGMFWDWLKEKAEWLVSWLPGAHSTANGASGSWVNSPPPIHVTVNHTTNVDGKTVARSVSHHQAAVTNRPQTGPSNFDTHLSPLRPDMAYGR